MMNLDFFMFLKCNLGQETKLHELHTLATQLYRRKKNNKKEYIENQEVKGGREGHLKEF